MASQSPSLLPPDPASPPFRVAASYAFPPGSASASFGPPYVLHLAHSTRSAEFLASTSSPSDGVHRFSADRLQRFDRIDTRPEARGRVNQIRVTQAPSASPECVAAAFERGTVAVWDLRDSRQPAVEICGPQKLPVLSLDFSPHAPLVALGTEVSTASEALVGLYDLRSPSSPVWTHADSHSDDVTSVQFHPAEPRLLLTASTDGLVATRDPNLSDEDDALLGSVDVGASIAGAGWAGERGAWARTDMETLAVLEVDQEGGVEVVGHLGDVRRQGLDRPEPGWKDPVDYAIDCAWEAGAGVVGYFAGSQGGDVAFIALSSPGECRTLASLRGGHSDIVRAALYEPHSQRFLTGGEDGRLCLWAPVTNEDPASTATGATNAIRSPSGGQTKRFKPY